jgi:GTPase
VVLVLDGSRSPPRMDGEVLGSLRRVGSRLVPAVNKTDLGSETDIQALMSWSAETLSAEPLPLSAETGEGVEELRSRIAALLPKSPFLYPEEEMSSQPVRFFVAELIRETLFEQFSQEVPYSTAVRIEEYRESAEPVFIRATVLVERSSQKAIVIGKSGSAIRALGSAARSKIEEFIGSSVYLDLWVKVLPSWRKSALELRRLGFALPDDKHRHA